MSTIESPGSLNSFQELRPELTHEEAKLEFDSAIGAYRRHLAESLGVTPEDLHERGINKIIDLTVEVQELK